MPWSSLVLALSLAVPVGLALGLLGGGGAILTLPLLVGVLHVEPGAAIASSLVVVGTTSAVAAVTHARAGRVDVRAALVFAATGMVGAFVGGKVAALLPKPLLLVFFSVVMAGAARAMWRGRPTDAAADAVVGVGGLVRLDRSTVTLVGQGSAIGALTGLVGAGGGFLLVPALTLLARLPMKKAVGTSLVVIALNSLAGLAGNVGHVDIPVLLTAVVTVGAVLGSFAGAAIAPHVAPERLRKAFAVFVAAMATLLLARQLVMFLFHE